MFPTFHSVTFDKKHTWFDWHLVPSSRPLFNPPSLKTHTVDIPGADGVIDETESLTGYPTFNNRTGSMEFIVMNGFQEWHELYTSISNYLHGRRMRIYLDDDPEWFYEGRVWVDEWRSEKDNSRISISYDVGPYKWRNESVLESDFSPYKNIAVSSSEKVIQIADTGRAPVCPTLIVSTSDANGVEVVYTDVDGNVFAYSVGDGRVEIPQIVFYGEVSGSMQIKCVGENATGTVTIDYREGSL